VPIGLLVDVVESGSRLARNQPVKVDLAPAMGAFEVHYCAALETNARLLRIICC
jgi:hypothetical protein